MGTASRAKPIEVEQGSIRLSYRDMVVECEPVM